MKKGVAIPAVLLFLVFCVCVQGKKQKLSHLHFYFHDIVAGKNASVVRATKPPEGNPTFFGMMTVMDDPLTETPDMNSKLFGYLQGIYTSASQHELRFLMTATFVFVSGKYNGSTLALLGSNPVLHDVREMAIVGGTGLFRLARGYAQAHTHQLDLKTGNAVVEYNVTVLHY